MGQPSFTSALGLSLCVISGLWSQSILPRSPLPPVSLPSPPPVHSIPNSIV